MSARTYDNSVHAWELRDGMVDRCAEKITAAATVAALDFEAALGLSLLAIAAAAGQDDRVLAWTRKLGAAYDSAMVRIFGLGGAS